ncbi:MAG TPA: sugar ABC transporter permease, partial [Candidatus Acidoferrum sp.]|nr:sugar ABC transporter permease [Candidatus Acidoferrum sp.]
MPSDSDRKENGSGRIRNLLDRLDSQAWWLFPLPIVLFCAFIALFPLGYTLYLSFHQWVSTDTLRFLGLRNYIESVFTSPAFLHATALTFYFTFVALGIQMVVGVTIAIVINREFLGQGFVRTIYLFPMMATPVAVAMIWMMMYNPTSGVLNFLLEQVGLPPQQWLADSRTVIPSLILLDTWQWVPLIVLICLAGLAALPPEPYESAVIDGANPWQVLRFITLPLLRPTIMVAALFRSIDLLKTFDIIYSTTGGGPGRASETLNIYIYQTSFRDNLYGKGAAMVTVFMAIVLG